MNFPFLRARLVGGHSGLAYVALLSIGLLASGLAAAQGSPAVMQSNRAAVTLADVEAELAKMPAAHQAQFVGSRVRVVQLINNLYLNRVLAAEARALGLDKDPVLARQLEQQAEKLLAQARLDRLDRETRDSLPARATQIEERAREIYVSNPARFQVPAQIHVEQVLVKVGTGGDAAALARAEGIRAQAIGGVNFGEIARDQSDDPSAKRNRGDIGMVPVDKLDPAFASAALALNSPGEISPVVKSSFGYHVIQFKAKKPARIRAFDEVRAELVSEIGESVTGDTRSLHMSLPFQPEPKIDEALLGQIMQGAQAVPPDKVKGAPPKR